MNPVMNFLMARGIDFFLSTKMLIDILGICILFMIASEKVFRRIMTSLCTLTTLVVIYEVVGVTCFS